MIKQTTGFSLVEVLAVLGVLLVVLVGLQQALLVYWGGVGELRAAVLGEREVQLWPGVMRELREEPLPGWELRIMQWSCEVTGELLHELRYYEMKEGQQWR